MIKYKLTCKDCSCKYDSWFASSKEFEKLKISKYLNCPSCNSLNIDKYLMAPSVLNNKTIYKKFIEITSITITTNPIKIILFLRLLFLLIDKSGCRLKREKI